MIETIFTPQLVDALGWTLLHSIWQGAIFAILLVLILIVFRSFTSQSRYVVSVGLFCAFFLVVSATFLQQWKVANTKAELSAQKSTQQINNDKFLFGNDAKSSSNITTTEILPPNEEISAVTSASWTTTFRDYFDRHLPLLVTFWFLGILFLQLRFLGQLAYVQRLKHYGTQLFPETWRDKIEDLEGKLRIQKRVKYLTSLRIESPMVIGWLKPVVLMPQQLFQNLTETEIYAVLAHELAHIRREDFIVNIIQTFLCNIFFFHPGVWWMSNRIDDEREHCCDDLAVAVTGQATSYAKTLINVSEYQLNQQGTPAMVMAFSGKNKRKKGSGFADRIRRLFVVKNGSGSFKEGFATASILMVVVILGIGATSRTALNSEDTSEQEPATVIESADELTPNSKLPTNEIITTTTTTTTISPGQVEQPIVIENNISDRVESTVTVVTQTEDENNARIDALIVACADGDLEFVQTLLNTGININEIGSDGFTPLMMAASNNKVDVVAYLLEKGADVNQISQGWTALIEAADEGAYESMKLLLEAGASVDYYKRINSPTAISLAASEGHFNCLQLLVSYDANVNGVGNSIPPLHIAAEEGKNDIVAFLFKQQVNINKKDSNGRTALMYAAKEGKLNTVSKLIEAGADASISDQNGNKASDYAAKEDQYVIQKYLNGLTTNSKENKRNEIFGKQQEIHQLTKAGQIEKVRRMVQNGVDVNSPDENGRTALHIASELGHNIDMQVLFDLGANINAQDEQGRTPLMYAARAAERDASVLLVSRQANINIQDIDGKRALEWARSGGHTGLVRFLGLITKEKSESVNKISNTKSHIKSNMISGKSSQKRQLKKETIHISPESTHLKQYDIGEENAKFLSTIKNGSVAQIRSMLAANIQNVNAADGTGQTALMMAVRASRFDVAKLLIENGADVNANSTSGLTALHYAALENQYKIADLLLKSNANVDPPMRYSSTDGNFNDIPLVWEYIGATPLLIAVESKNIEVLSLLMNAGANKNQKLTKKEYRLPENRETYLSASEVMGLDVEFLEHFKVRVTDDTWTPYKQALLMNDSETISFFAK